MNIVVRAIGALLFVLAGASAAFAQAGARSAGAGLERGPMTADQIREDIIGKRCDWGYRSFPKRFATLMDMQQGVETRGRISFGAAAEGCTALTLTTTKPSKTVLLCSAPVRVVGAAGSDKPGQLCAGPQTPLLDKEVCAPLIRDKRSFRWGA